MGKGVRSDGLGACTGGGDGKVCTLGSGIAVVDVNNTLVSGTVLLHGVGTNVREITGCADYSCAEREVTR